MTLTNHFEKGTFNQEIIIHGSKGYLKAVGATVYGLIHSSGSRTSVNKQISDASEDQSAGSSGKEVVLYEDSQDADFLLIDRNLRNNDEVLSSSPLLPSIYMDG